jgi:hypothetical protein
MGLGPNIAHSFQDVSETGARLTVKVDLPIGHEVELSLCGLGHRRPVKSVARVIWSLPTSPGIFLIGVRFDRPLRYLDLQELGR